MQRRRFLSEALGTLGALGLPGALAGCRRTSAPGRGVSRVVSMAASTTEGLFAIGAGPLVVGRSRYCDYPPEVRALPSVGGFIDPSLEAILGLRPDLVVGARGPLGPGFIRTLEERGIQTWFPETESFAAIDELVLGLGARTDRVEPARALVARMHARRDALATALAGAKRPRALLLFEKKPISAAGPGSFPDEMLRLAGATNALVEGGRYANLSLEKVIALDPDVLLDAEMGATATAFDSTWSGVRAVRDGRVARIGDESVLRPGPRVYDGVAVIARALHPELALPLAPP